MNQATISLPLGKATLSIPADEAVRILLEKFAHEAAPAVRNTHKPPRIGEVWPGQGGVYAGLMRGENGKPDYHMIVPTDPSAIFEEVAWGGYDHDEPGAKSEYDGLANTLALCASEVEHPAAQQAASLVIDGHNDFYLMARREAALCYANVPELFEKAWHWTSTQYSRYHAYVQGFDRGTQYSGGKRYEGRARAVRRIIDLPI